MLRIMSRFGRRSSFAPLLILLLVPLLICGCRAAVPVPPRHVVAPPRVQPTPPAQDGLYAADEALRDALSGPLEHLGTGAWPGNNRIHACAFRNARVLVVNAYCTPTESQAFRVDVYSPTRGRLRIYAEADGPISVRAQTQYFTFKAESEPPAPSATLFPPLSLTMSFDQLRSYEEQRYRAYLPACFGGLEHGQKRSGCLGTLAARSPAWNTRNGPFLERANSDWYRIIRELRTMATRYGKDPQ